MRSIELIGADYATQRFSHHWHSGFAIGAVTERAQGFHANDREWLIEEGDLIVLNPGQIHDGYALDKRGWSSRMAYIPRDLFLQLTGLAADDDQVPLGFTTAVVRSPALWRIVVDWHRSSEGGADLRSDALTARVFAALRSLLEPLSDESSRTADASVAADLHQRLRQLAAHGDTSLAGLNAALNLSRFGSWRRVKTELGLAPKPLLNQYRLMAARQMLARGRPVIAAAMDCGYHDQSHFTRQFAAAYGMTPAQFRRVQLGALRDTRRD